MMTELSCQEFVELVTAYLEEKLPAAERARFEEHLAGCDDCGTYLEQMCETIRMLGRLPEDAVPAEAQQKLLQAFRDWRRG